MNTNRRQFCFSAYLAGAIALGLFVFFGGPAAWAQLAAKCPGPDLRCQYDKAIKSMNDALSNLGGHAGVSYPPKCSKTTPDKNCLMAGAALQFHLGKLTDLAPFFNSG